ncbi:MAG: methylenetetrahydrofolate--tRNA-(uracil(54)-C(5))-methyltransferase (FADH(2)-oxidizing) TrmFO [Anaerolineales bacterium]|nr:methylenetetrahydrofolate--tRNA-(uracil(54)-C(5))-methyltransferase (FADH(2)-oxidizing) TrmFO [Anaerolineales bacterium]
MKENGLIVVGGGLAGCEAAWQAAQRGVRVRLYEMRPLVNTGAHVTDRLAELVCSNSFGSNQVDRGTGLLLNELRMLGSFLIRCADEAALPAGRALAVDRDKFSQRVTKAILEHPNITVIREEVKSIPEAPAIIASGPLTSESLSASIATFLGQANLFFYDAISPIVEADTINMSIAFRASRYDQESNGDYINCPMNQDEYEYFVNELIKAERIPLRPFEEKIESGVISGKGQFFEACLPIEVLAQRGKDALAYGPLRPVGLRDPRTGKRPYAVVQLRQDNLAGTLYNMVGFQTNLTFPEQKRVFRLIPGLEYAEFSRYGQMHRNTYIFSPQSLKPTLQTMRRPDLFMAGQIIGVEGYAGNIASGWLAGVNAARFLQGRLLFKLPRETMIGSLIYYITHASEKDFQPMKSNFGLLPYSEDEWLRNKKQRHLYFVQRSKEILGRWIEEFNVFD